MAKVAIRTPEQARYAAPGAVEYFGEGCPLLLSRHAIAPGTDLALPSAPVDRLIYVLAGEVARGEQPLPIGSAIIVERGAACTLRGSADGSTVLRFAGARPSQNQRPGGHVHLLPADRVPSIASITSGVSGAIFADGGCPSCEVWLHQNRLAPRVSPPADPRAGVHSHDEDEIIFITEGQMQLGHRRVGPGTAIAIAAGTLYRFLPGPDGLTFINFRAGKPGLVHFADGRSMDEVAIWSGTDRPLEYVNA